MTELRELSQRLEEQCNLLQGRRRWPASLAEDLPPVAIIQGEALLELGPLIDRAHDPINDPLVREMTRMQPFATRLHQADSEQSALEALLEFERRPPGSVGNQANWVRPAKREVHPVKQAKDLFKGPATTSAASSGSTAQPPWRTCWMP